MMTLDRVVPWSLKLYSAFGTWDFSFILPAAAAWHHGFTFLASTLWSAFYFVLDHVTWVQIPDPSLPGHFWRANDNNFAKLSWDLQADSVRQKGDELLKEEGAACGEGKRQRCLGGPEIG